MEQDGVTEEMFDCGKVDALPPEASRCAARGSEWRELITINDKSVEMKRMKKWHCKKSTLKELLQILHNTENAKDKMLETDPNFYRSMKVHQGIEKMLAEDAD